MSTSRVTQFSSILVMLCDNCCLPCYKFENSCKNKINLSVKDLGDILLWASEFKPVMPDIFFLVGDNEQLSPSLTAVLEDVSDAIITPLLSIDEQMTLGIPFSPHQTVVANSLRDIIAKKDSIAGRPVILHVERPDIKNLARSFLAIQDSMGTITLRLYNIHLLTDNDLQIYEQQLIDISKYSFAKSPTTLTNTSNLLRPSSLNSANKSLYGCHAGEELIVIGPDGNVYPCPAFYKAGSDYSIGAFYLLKDGCIDSELNLHKCSICSLNQCPGCPFLESGQLIGRENICRVHQAEFRAAQELISKVAKSGYLFDCLWTWKIRECIAKSESEGNEHFNTELQIHEVDYDELVSALLGLRLAAELIINQTFGSSKYPSISDRWSELPEIPLNSQRGIFRRRVREILTELCELRNSTAVKPERMPMQNV